MKISSTLYLLPILILSCNTQQRVKPFATTQRLNSDPDDVAVWIHPEQPLKSVIFLNDKNTSGGVYGFDISGKAIPELSISPLSRPNNLDIASAFINPYKNDSTVPVLFVAERETQRIRAYTVPHLNALDSGGYIAFNEDSSQNVDFHAPMGIAVMNKSPFQNVDIFVSRKSGPLQGYLHHYRATWAHKNKIDLQFIRSFGTFSGLKEIESIALDTLKNRVYYSDETYGIRYASADPNQSDTGSFGIGTFKSDCEGIAVIHSLKKYPNGLIIVSDQKRNNLNFFDRETLLFIGYVEIAAKETDGIEFSTLALLEKSEGTLFAMNNKQHNFHYYTIESLLSNLKTP